MTNGQRLAQVAERCGVPVRTLAQVQAGLTLAKELGSDSAMARLMLNHGRISDEAREWIVRTYNR